MTICRSELLYLQFAICIVQIAVFTGIPRGTFSAEPLDHVAGAEVVVTPMVDVIHIFDGQTLGDCYTWLKDTKREDPRQVFRVLDGMLHFSGDGLGGVITNKRYRDYHLILEFKWGERTWRERENSARDSGLLIHSNGINGGYDGTWMPAIEVQIIEGGVGDIVPVPGNGKDGRPIPISYTCKIVRDRDGEVVWNPSGEREHFHGSNLKRVNWYGRDPDWADVKNFRGPDDQDSPLGKWTRIDVFCSGGHVKVFVNGTKVNEAFDVSPCEGRLQLQSELAEIYFRRWELWPLDKGPKPEQATQ